jgi:hypothetical protein
MSGSSPADQIEDAEHNRRTAIEHDHDPLHTAHPTVAAHGGEVVAPARRSRPAPIDTDRYGGSWSRIGQGLAGGVRRRRVDLDRCDAETSPERGFY